MSYNITRRDFINGMAVSAGASMLTPAELLARAGAGVSASYYPPTKTGIRGNHPGSFEVSHALAWNGIKPDKHRALAEHYDLIVVGAGVSGLAAARFYQQQMGPAARILLLDNHDDFGGHAKRNEFHQEGRMLLGVGGSVNLDSPGDYSDVTKALLDDLGVDLDAMAATSQKVDIGSASNESVLALRGPDGYARVRGRWGQLMLGIGDYASAIRALPLPNSEQEKLIELVSGERDYLADLALEDRYAFLTSVTYATFLTERVGLAHETISIFYPFAKLMTGAAAFRISVMEAFYLGCPGVQGMDWLGEQADQLVKAVIAGYDSMYFPDGNASVARLLVHKLIPAASPESAGFADIATSRLNYEALDRRENPVRIRLNSTVVHVHEVGNQEVAVDYICDGDAARVTGDHCVLACYNGAIPHICPELPATQKEALRYGVKVPLVLTNVLVRNREAFARLGVQRVSCPNDPYVLITQAPNAAIGGYRPPEGTDEPMVIFMLGVPLIDRRENERTREILLRSRHQLYTKTFASYEQEVREQLQGILGAHGFNHETDIQAITVNRWPHGYAYEYLAIDDPEWEEGQAPHELGRAQFGRISIANSDSEARAYLDAAIDAGWRAVTEQTT